MRNRDVLAMVTALFGLLGCGGDDPKSEEGTSGKLDSKLCTSLCERSVKADCKDGDDKDDCTSECKDVIKDVSKKCTSDLEEYLSCGAKATFSCDSDDSPVAKSCEKEWAAYQECEEGPVADAGAVPNNDAAPQPVVPDAGQQPKADAGPPVPPPGGDAGQGSGTPMCTADGGDGCDRCLAQKCCTQYVNCRKSGPCDSLYKCILDCDTQACATSCRQQFSAGDSLLQPFAQCLTTTCKSECSSSSSLRRYGFNL